MGTKHTPGPWMLGGCSGRMVKPVGPYVGDGFVADVDTLANARLIAAAPDLLNALERAIQVIRMAQVPGSQGIVAEFCATIRNAGGEG